MNTRLIFAIALLTLAAMPGRSSETDKDVIYASPNQELRARVHTDSRGESSVRIEDARTGAILLLRDDTSSDGAHGHSVVRGAWTSDSLFFVASLESSAPHPAWAHPIWVYSRAANHVVELSALGLTVVASFQLRSPDVLKTRVLGTDGNGQKAGRPFEASLHTLLTTAREAKQ
jgi:hypothetical protein